MNSSAQTTAPDDIDRILHAAMADESLELPPPPQVASEVMRLTRGEAAGRRHADASATELARLIQRDIALAGQVMRVANSALYARRTPVVTLPQAIAWLGIREVRNIAFAVARARARCSTPAYFRHEMTDLWRESVITALFAQEIARLKRRNVDSAYLCGLLHRVGMAVILSRVGAAALKRLNLTPDPAQVLAARRAPRSRASARSSASPGNCRPRCPRRSRTGAIRRRPSCRAPKSWKSRSRGRSPMSCAHPASAASCPTPCSGPVSQWMDELSIYPDELFSIMAQRAAIYATAESYT